MPFMLGDYLAALSLKVIMIFAHLAAISKMMPMAFRSLKVRLFCCWQPITAGHVTRGLITSMMKQANGFQQCAWCTSIMR